MVNYSTDVLKDVWVAISDNKDYVLQNKGTGSILVKASDIMPTDAVGAIEVQGKKWITSKELYGKVWCSAAMETQPIAYGTGDTVSSGGGSGGSTIDRELVVTMYTCKTAFTGASVGDTITATQIIDVTDTPTTVSTVWRNQTTNVDLASAPSSAKLTLAGAGIGLTDGQLRATPVAVTGINTPEVVNAVPDVETALEVATQWGGFAGVNTAGGDFITNIAGVNGQAIKALSVSPLTTGESSVVNYNKAVQQPCSMEFAASFVRGGGIGFAMAHLFADDPVNGPDPVPSPINIVSYYQSSATAGSANSGSAGTVMHMLLETALPAVGANNAVFIGDWINITGLVDTRFNYPNACINYISPDRKTISVGFSDEVALPSLVSPASGVTAVTLGTGKVNFFNAFGGARNAFGLRFTGTTPTSAAVVSIFGGDDNQVSGALLGDHRVSIASTAPTYVPGALMGQYEIRASSRFKLECTPDVSLLLDKGEQTLTTWTAREPRTSVKPSTNALLYPRFVLYKPVSMSRPIATIVKAEKLTATTTATITTDVAHGLVTGNYVTIKGIANQTVFASFTAPAAVTVVNATSFTVTIGTATIATSYGGSVIIANGGKDQPGIINNTIQNAVSFIAEGNNWLNLTGAVTWAGLVNLGDYINIHGVRNTTTGADLGLDGAWEVAHINTTALFLKPIFDIAGNRVSPALGTLASVACGGSAIIRQTLRSHNLSVSSWKDMKIGIDGAGTARPDKAIPVYGLGGSLGVFQGSAGVIGTGGVGAWIVRGSAHTTADIASAAFTTVGVTTGTAIDVTGNTGSMQINTDVTAVSGTSPRLINRLQGSFDGINFVNIYDVGVMTTSTAKNNDTPVIPVEFRSIRHTMDCRGTTPSFTRSVNRVMRPMEASKRQRRLLDRVVGLNTTTASTEWLYVGGCTNAQIMSTAMAGQTVAAVVKVQLCQGDPAIAANWYDVPSAPTLTTSASAPVVTAPFVIGNAKFARLVPTTAGTGIVADTYELALTAWE